MIGSLVRICSLIAIAIAAMGCQTRAEPSPAVLVNADDETMVLLHGVLADAMGQAQVELGPSDPTQDATVAVLPPPLGPGEDRSTVTPTYFDLMMDEGGACMVVRRDTGETFPLNGASCRAL